MDNPEKCPCGSGLRPWWRDDWRADPMTTWICDKCQDDQHNREVMALVQGAHLALAHLRLCGDRSESAAECGSRAIELLETGLGLSHTEAAKLALSRMKGRL